MDDLPVALLVVDRNGRLQYANSLARQLIGPKLGLGVLLSDLMEGPGRALEDWLTEALASHGASHCECVPLKRSDREVFVQITLRRTAQKSEPALIATLTDITEAKRLETQFLQCQKMQAIGQLAGNIAHDFNNLLTAIAGHCDLMRMRRTPGDSDYEDLAQIVKNTERATALVAQLLAYSRKQTLRPEKIDLHEALTGMVPLLDRLVGENITLVLSHGSGLPMIRADRQKLEQVLMNLAVNACDAMPNGGVLRIFSESLRLASPRTRDGVEIPKGHYARLRVEDEGTGIAPEVRHRLFEPFFTTKHSDMGARGKGIGLGLSTAYGIMKQTGGYIFADNRAQGGACLTLLFPTGKIYEKGALAAPQPAQSAPEPARAHPMDAPAQATCILLVEDDAAVRRFTTKALKIQGYTVHAIDSGEAALQWLETAAAPVDLFVSDVVMPGLDGPSWVRKARKTHPHCPVVFISGYAEDSFPKDQARIPNSTYLPKPFSLHRLGEVIRAQLQ